MKLQEIEALEKFQEETLMREDQLSETAQTEIILEALIKFHENTQGSMMMAIDQEIQGLA